MSQARASRTTGTIPRFSYSQNREATMHDLEVFPVDLSADRIREIGIRATKETMELQAKADELITETRELMKRCDEMISETREFVKQADDRQSERAGQPRTE
jgi:ElaB/YqjD/DUF883 family membrane-anchored ribosome-binding protein